jgi:hypothetical protein
MYNFLIHISFSKGDLRYTPTQRQTNKFEFKWIKVKDYFEVS